MTVTPKTLGFPTPVSPANAGEANAERAYQHAAAQVEAAAAETTQPTRAFQNTTDGEIFNNVGLSQANWDVSPSNRQVRVIVPAQGEDPSQMFVVGSGSPIGPQVRRTVANEIGMPAGLSRPLESRPAAFVQGEEGGLALLFFDSKVNAPVALAMNKPSEVSTQSGIASEDKDKVRVTSENGQNVLLSRAAFDLAVNDVMLNAAKGAPIG